MAVKKEDCRVYWRRECDGNPECHNCQNFESFATKLPHPCNQCKFKTKSNVRKIPNQQR